MFNGKVESGRVQCHGSGDIVSGPNCDWARVSDVKYILQKLVLYFSLPKGEVVGEPNIGCCLYEYLFSKLDPETLCEVEIRLESEIQQQIPELNTQMVSVYSLDRDSIRVKIVGFGTWILDVFQNDLLSINLANILKGET